MATELLQLYSQNHWLSDGTDTIWNFTFADGYINKAYVKAFTLDELNVRTQIPLSDANFIGEFQLSITPNITAGLRFVVLRDTPKDAPLVNFQDGARVSEVNLDLIARQATHIAAEVLDGSGQTILLDEYGFKAMQQIPYTGSSVVLVADNGRAHYKTDNTGVTVPNTLPNTFLSTILNDSTSPMNITFADAVAVQQGSDDTTGTDTWTLAPQNSLSIYKVRSGLWFISGKVE